MTSLDFSKLPNPYDFANPVNDPLLFAGRSKEREEIDYYLNHAHLAARPINLAIIGERASGKTSLLNMIAVSARKRNCCVVRVDLDEGDVATQLAFFYKLFDSILTGACEDGAFGGLVGRTYDTYREIVDACRIPDDLTFCPFVFPTQYARSVASGNANAVLSDNNFKRDIGAIREELDRTIVILIDECDVLTQSRVHIEKVRNIFMNTPGFMLVLTGTPSLFPVMDEVFSPIVRQFKKIDVGPFREEQDTENCIRRPLERIGISDLEEVMSAETYADVSEIHDLSGGRPYEIQLICHFLFRRMQQQRTKRMDLTLDVLDDVRRELEATQDISARPVLGKVSRFSDEELEALKTLCKCDGRASFEQIWFREHVFPDETLWDKKDLEALLGKFIDIGVLSLDGGQIRFNGDDFDRIYCKYFARKRSVPLSISAMPYPFYLALSLQAWIEEYSDDAVELAGPFMSFGGATDEWDLASLRQSFVDDASLDLFTISPELAQNLYTLSFRFHGSTSFTVAAVSLVTPWVTVEQIYAHASPDHSDWPMTRMQDILGDPSQRASELGGSVVVSVSAIPIVPRDALIDLVKRSQNGQMRNVLSNWHYGEMADAYVERHDIDRALMHGNLAYEYDPSPSAANNLGYVHIAKGDLDGAEHLLRVSQAGTDDLTTDPTISVPGLATYNLGIVAAMRGDISGAAMLIKRSIDLSAASQAMTRHCDCLWRPEAAPDGTLTFAEVTQVDLLAVATSASEVIEGFADQAPPTDPSFSGR